MIIAGIVTGCVIAWLYTARRIFYVMRQDSDPDDRSDQVAVGVLAMLTGLLWPLALPVALVMWHPRKTPAELQEELKARNRRIAELEREAGIRPG